MGESCEAGDSHAPALTPFPFFLGGHGDLGGSIFVFDLFLIFLFFLAFLAHPSSGYRKEALAANFLDFVEGLSPKACP
jgi:hypothetical protein